MAKFQRYNQLYKVKRTEKIDQKELSVQSKLISYLRLVEKLI